MADVVGGPVRQAYLWGRMVVGGQVVDVVPGGAAAERVRPRDIILSVDGVEVSTPQALV